MGRIMDVRLRIPIPNERSKETFAFAASICKIGPGCLLGSVSIPVEKKGFAMKKLLAVALLLVMGQGLAAVAAEPPQEPGPFKSGNKALGTWKHVVSGKASPITNDKTTTETTLVSKPVVNGWYIESVTVDGPNPSMSLTAGDPAGNGVRVWLFAQNNVVTLSGKINDAGVITSLSGKDQYGNAAELTEKWIDDDHREGTFIVKSKDGAVLIDVSSRLSRVSK